MQVRCVRLRRSARNSPAPLYGLAAHLLAVFQSNCLAKLPRLCAERFFLKSPARKSGARRITNGVPDDLQRLGAFLHEHNPSLTVTPACAGVLCGKAVLQSPKGQRKIDGAENFTQLLQMVYTPEILDPIFLNS